MPTIRIGRKTVAAIGTPDKPTIFFDETLAGFGLRVRPTGARSWVVEYRPNGGGRKVAKRRMTLGDPAVMTPEEARSAARTILARVTGGADPAAERSEARKAETVAEIAERWLAEHIAPKRAVRTFQFYRTGLDRHVLPAIGQMKARDLTRRDVMKLHGQIAAKAVRLEKPGKRQPKERTLGGPVTANRALAGLSAMLSWAGRAGLVPEGNNPALGVERFKEEAKERFLDTNEIGRLGEALRLAETTGIPWVPQDESRPGAKHLPKPANRVEVFGAYPPAAVRLLLLTGMRLREVLNLEWSHVDRQRGMLNLPASKTGRKTIVLGAAAIALLDDVPRLGRYVIASTSAGLAGEQPRRDINRAWAAIRRHAGLEGVRLHDLRHSFAATGAAGGASLPQIGSLLGHRVAQTTMRYAHVAASAERRVADAIGVEIADALGLPGAAAIDLNARRQA